MTPKQYQIILDLYHEMHDEFRRLSIDTKMQFMDILQGLKTLNTVTGKYE